MRLETRYIDIGKSISIIDQNFHIDFISTISIIYGNTNKHPWMLSVSHLDTSACQIVGHFFQVLCMQYTNPSPWMVGRTDERMKWQQYPSASMLAKGKSAFLTLCHSFPVTCQQMCKNLKMWLTDLLTDKRTDRRTWQGGTIAGGYCYGPLNLV